MLIIKKKIFKLKNKDFNSREKENRCPNCILTSSCSKEILNKWLTMFIAETCVSLSKILFCIIIFHLIQPFVFASEKFNCIYNHFISKCLFNECLFKFEVNKVTGFISKIKEIDMTHGLVSHLYTSLYPLMFELSIIYIYIYIYNYNI